MSKMKYNYRKSKNSILLSILLVFCLTFTGIWLVRAEGDDGLGHSIGGGGGTGGNPAPEQCTYFLYDNTNMGLRISLVDNAGNRISGTSSIDIWTYTPTMNVSKIYYFPGNQRNKQEVISSIGGGQYSFGSLTLTDYISSSVADRGKGVQNILSSYLGTSRIQGAEGGTVLKSALQKMVKDANDTSNYEVFDAILSAAGYTGSHNIETMNDEEKNNLYFQMEPLLIVMINTDGSGYKGIYGSLTEIAYLNDTRLGNASGCGARPPAALIKNTSAALIASRSECTSDKPTECAPNNFQTVESRAQGAEAYLELRSNSTESIPGQAVTFIWGGSLGKSPCTTAVNDIIARYGKTGPAVDKAIEELFAGTYILEDGTLGVLKPTDLTKNGLTKAIYDTRMKDGVLVGPQCDNYTPLPPPPVPCGADAEATVEKDDCTTGMSYFKDDGNESNWLVCEIAFTHEGVNYSSDNTGHEAVETTNGGIVGNDEYCELFCYEEMETNFPTAVFEVKAGQTFVWGDKNGKYGIINIHKYCSNQVYKRGQQGYRFEEWEEDFRDNQKKQVDNYLDWQFNEWANGTINIWASGTCCIGNCGTALNPSCCSRPTRYVGTKSSYSRTHTDSWLPSVNGSTDGAYSASGCSYGEVYSALYVSTGGYQSAYTSAKNNEQPLLEKIRQCTNNIKYVYETVVTFVFQEPGNEAYGGSNDRDFGGTWELEIEPDKENGYNKDNVDKSTCVTKIVYSYNCSGSGTGATCTPISEEVLDCVQVTWDIEGTYTYSYPMDEFQWFSDKRDSTLVNEKEKPSGDEAYFYSIGFGLPTAFSLTNGTYDMAVVVDNLGDNATTNGAQDYNTENGHFGPVSDIITNVVINGNSISVDEAYGFEYKCTYEVINEMFGYDCFYNGDTLTGNSPIYCDSTSDENSNGELNGIDIAYRIISLLSGSDDISKAFPGIDGIGRDQGDNWALEEDVIKEILRDDIYEGARYTDASYDQYESLAMYEIMLDVNAIQYIRKSNSEYFENEMDPYTSYVDANNHVKVYCKSKGVNEEYKYCASEFLTELQTTSRLTYNLMGTCLPVGMGTAARAQDVLDNGCYTTYTYPTINWAR